MNSAHEKLWEVVGEMAVRGLVEGALVRNGLRGSKFI